MLLNVTNFFSDLFKCLKAGIPYKSPRRRLGYSLWAIQSSFKYLLNPRSKIRVSSRNHIETGEVWGVYQLWLDFAYQYVSVRDFTACPAIDSVSGPAISNDAVRAYSLNKINNYWVELVAKGMSKTFKKPNCLAWQKHISAHAGLWEVLSNNFDTKELHTIIEIGGGATASNLTYLSAIMPNTEFINFDLPAMLRVQNICTQSYKLNSYEKDSKLNIIQYSDITKLTENCEGKNYCIISYWAFTEMPIEIRKSFLKLLSRAHFIGLAANSTFEGVDNSQYIESLAEEINFAHEVLPLPLDNLMNFQKKHRFHILSKK